MGRRVGQDVPESSTCFVVGYSTKLQFCGGNDHLYTFIGSGLFCVFESVVVYSSAVSRYKNIGRHCYQTVSYSMFYKRKLTVWF